VKYKFTSEVNLCKPAIQWLQDQHWDVYQEVEYGNCADIVAVRGLSIWVIEAKLTLSLSLVDQALSWQQYANYVSVLIPKRNRRAAGYGIVHKLGIGMIEVNPEPNHDGSYDVSDIHGRFVRPKSWLRQRILDALHPCQLTGEKGEAGNASSTRWTPYKQTMDGVKRYLQSKGPSTLKQIIQATEHHYAHDKSALQCMRKALDVWEDWCRVDVSGKELLYSVNAQPQGGNSE